MNNTVWVEQIDRGLKTFISNLLKLRDNEGNIRNIPVFIKKPDEDFKVEEYPMVTVYLVNTSKRDALRYYPFKVPRNTDIQTGTTVMERTAVPYTLTYQIGFWSTLQRDMNELTKIWNFEVSNDFNLPVIDSGGESRSTLCVLTDTITKSDKLNGTDRVFCTIYTYHIWAEIDEENETVLEQVPIVTDPKLIVNGIQEQTEFPVHYVTQDLYKYTTNDGDRFTFKE